MNNSKNTQLACGEYLKSEAKRIIELLELNASLSNVDIRRRALKCRHTKGEIGKCPDTHRWIITISSKLSLGTISLRRVLAHELKHLEQYQTGRLVKVADGIQMWDGKMVNESGFAYRELPWELDAQEVEERYIRTYLSSRVNVFLNATAKTLIPSE